MKELVIDAKRENLPAVLAFVDEQLEAVECPMLTQTSIDVAVEEVFINIASYAYDTESGTATVQVTVLQDPLSVEITFIDNGTQYDPLAKEDPDITLPKQKRKKGGLGIFMVKKTMDDVVYEYKYGKNILTIKKKLNEE
jgi:anti-sigma regulatory factor (Ser/Thr protein kinase)